MKISSPQDAAALGIATVYQDLALCDNLDVVANLYLGREVFAKGVARAAYFIDETAMEQSALELLDSLAVTTIKDVRAHVGSLSGGQRQAVAIARSLLGEPSVVLLDEPTAALGVSQTEQVLNLIGTLRERGLGVVVISHNLENVFAVADRIIVLRLGRRAATFDVRGVSREDVVAAITGAEFGLGADDPQGERMSAERETPPVGARHGRDVPGPRPQARRGRGGHAPRPPDGRRRSGRSSSSRTTAS